MEHQILNTGLSPLVQIICGLLVRYFVAKNIFNRRGIAGQQQFNSYLLALLTSIVEWLLKWIANLIIIIGIVSLVIH